MNSSSLNRITGCELFFKCENFQRAGAFKYRGVNNAIIQLVSRSKIDAVATHSSGNHAGALALASSNFGIKCYVVMPDNSPQIKIDAVKEYGAEIVVCQPTLQAREDGLKEVIEKTGATFIHPYNNFHIIAGQGTAALEILEDMKSIDVIIAPVGGGGLLSGTAIAAKSIKHDILVFGAEPKGADDAFRSMQEKRIMPSVNPKTIADGLLTSLGSLTFKAISDNVDEILTVSEDSIRKAMLFIWERMKLVVEPSGCVPLAAVLGHRNYFINKKVAIILSGGNADIKTIISL
ncbi:L-threo-3-hydroxyaspartate ammonia-lyase [subsurface metagenome]